MAAARERISPVLKTALITVLVLIPPAVFGGVIGQTVLGPMLLIIVGGLVTSTLCSLFVFPLLMFTFGPKEGPEEWESVNESEVPVLQEKVEVK